MKRNAKPRFELSTDSRSKTRQYSRSARGRSARQARELSFARCYVTVEYCAQHALEGMVYVKSNKCKTEGCGKSPSFGVAGSKTVEYCAQHALEGMVNVKSSK